MSSQHALLAVAVDLIVAAQVWQAAPDQGILAGLTLEATVGPRSLDEVAPPLPFCCFCLPTGPVPNFFAWETALLTGPISELVTELRGDDGRSMADESEPWALPAALPVTPSALPDP